MKPFIHAGFRGVFFLANYLRLVNGGLGVYPLRSTTEFQFNWCFNAAFVLKYY